MGRRNLIVVGASAGGVEALKELVEGLPADLPAAVVIVLHIAPSATSVLPAILARAGKLPAAHAAQGDRLEPGKIYIAPPDCHLLVHRNSLRLSHGPRVNGHRPAVDALFISAARWHEGRVISVVLSGVLDDGTVGTGAVKRAGGATIAQSPETALYPQMPTNAIEVGGASIVEPLSGIAGRLVRLLAEEIELAPEEANMPEIEDELAIDPEGSAAITGPASGFTCPDCHGALWELHDAAITRYRCRIGHSYGPETLLAQQSEKIEDALWAGYRALEESASLAKKMADRAEERGATFVAERYRAKYDDALDRARTLRRVLEEGQLYTMSQPK